MPCHAMPCRAEIQQKVRKLNEVEKLQLLANEFLELCQHVDPYSAAAVSAPAAPATAGAAGVAQGGAPRAARAAVLLHNVTQLI